MQDLQNMRDRIDRQMAQMQQPQMSGSQTPAINQTFQLSNPTNSLNDFDGKYVSNVDEVKNTLTLKNTLFVNKGMNMLYSDMKNVLGEGNDEESIKKYIQASKDWLNDEDVGESKLFKYYRYVVQK